MAASPAVVLDVLYQLYTSSFQAIFIFVTANSFIFHSYVKRLLSEQKKKHAWMCLHYIVIFMAFPCNAKVLHIYLL